MTTTTQAKPVLCPCGEAADPDELALAEYFPTLKRPILCRGCAEEADRQARAREAEEAERRRQAELEARLNTIPPEMLETDVTDPRFNAGLWVQVERWSPNSGRWLGIWGPAGRCKTRVVAMIAARLIRAGVIVAWQPAVSLQRRAERRFSGTDLEKAAAHRYLDHLGECGLLVLDDLGKNTWTPSFESLLFEILDHRKTHHLPVIWTSNAHPIEILKSGELSRHRDAPLIGRLIEASGGNSGLVSA